MSDDALLDCCILVVDDELANIRLLERVLARAGYSNIHSTPDPRQVIGRYRELRPDILLLDLMMPYLDGNEVLRLLAAETAEGPFVPRLVLTADVSVDAKNKALALGATDFLTKPFDQLELLLRIRNALHTRALSLDQYNQAQILERRVRERTQQLELARLEVIERLARVAEFRDDETHKHTRRVGEASAALARILGLPGETVEIIRRIAPLHDIGKIGIPDRILFKPAGLTHAEFEQMKRHTLIGAQMLEGGRSDLIRMAEELALTHHERWGGGGYPSGIRGTDIPLISRIVSVIDVFDALTHARPYKEPWTLDRAVFEIMRLQGRYFDPEVVAAFCMALDRGEICPPGQASVEVAEPFPTFSSL